MTCLRPVSANVQGSAFINELSNAGCCDMREIDLEGPVDETVTNITPTRKDGQAR
jgi:hypothetical protein